MVNTVCIARRSRSLEALLLLLLLQLLDDDFSVAESAASAAKTVLNSYRISAESSGQPLQRTEAEKMV